MSFFTSFCDLPQKEQHRLPFDSSRRLSISDFRVGAGVLPKFEKILDPRPYPRKGTLRWLGRPRGVGTAHESPVPSGRRDTQLFFLGSKISSMRPYSLA